MHLYSGIAEASDAARSFFIINRSELPAVAVDKLQTLVGTGASPIDLVVAFVEIAFANRGEVPVEMLEIAAGLGLVILQYGFYESLGGRAEGIVMALRRDSGEAPPAGLEWPVAAADPAPDSRYAEQPLAPASPPPGAPVPPAPPAE